MATEDDPRWAPPMADEPEAAAVDPVFAAMLARNYAVDAKVAVPRPRVYVRYMRYSTENQDEDSITRQRRSTDRYAAKKNFEYADEYIDRAKSAKRANDRPALVRLRKDMKRGIITDIVVERYNRVTRESLDAAMLYEELREADISLHHALKERVMSKLEQLRDAEDAEADRLERQNMMSIGKEIKVEKDGLAVSVPFGYARGTRNGYPVIHEEDSKVVLRIFTLVQTWSCEEVAKLLGEENAPTPDGAITWNASSIRYMVRNGMYAGRMTTNKTKQFVDRHGAKDPRLPVPSGEVSMKKTERNRIVSDEDWNAANAAINARRKHEIRPPGTPRTTRHLGLVGHVRCDCPGVELQTYFRTAKGTNKVKYQCSRYSACKGTQALDAKAIDAKVLDLLQERLGASQQPAADESFRRIVASRLATAKSRARTFQEQIDTDNLMAERLLDQALTEGAAPERLARRQYELETSISLAKVSLNGELETIAKLEQGESPVAVLRSRLSTARGELPFLPISASHVGFAQACQAALPRVQVVTQNLPPARRELHVEIDREMFGFNAEGESNETIVMDIVFRRTPKTLSGDADPATIAKQVAAFAPTDRQWAIVEDHILAKRRKILDRNVMAVAIWAMRTGLPIRWRPEEYGPIQYFDKRLAELILHGDFDVIIDILGQDDPAWLVGLDVDRFEDVPRSDAGRERLGKTNPKDAVGTARSLSDEEWNASLAVIDPRVERDRLDRLVDVRNLIDGTLFCMERGLPWSQMPERYGDRKLVRLGMVRLVYTESWQRLLALWSERFPELVRGLPIERMIKVPSLADLRRARNFKENNARRRYKRENVKAAS